MPDGTAIVGTIGRRTGGPVRNFDRIANNIERIAFAYAYDAAQDGEVDSYTGPTSPVIIWAYDSDDDGDLDVDIAGNPVTPNVPIDRIRMVRIWAVARSARQLRGYNDTRTYMNGTPGLDHEPAVVFDPGTDGDPSPYTVDDSYMRRQLDTIIKCRNMGLRITTS